MQTAVFDVYREHGCTPEPTYENGLLLALQACSDPAHLELPIASKQLLIVVTAGLAPESRDPRRWRQTLDDALRADWLVELGENLQVTEAGLARSRELCGVLPPRWRPVPHAELNGTAYAATGELSWEYQRGILLKVYYQGQTFAYPRRLRQELGPVWATLMPPSLDKGWNAVETLESALVTFEPIPATAWEL